MNTIRQRTPVYRLASCLVTLLLIVTMPGVTPKAAASAASAAPEMTRINNSSTRTDPPAGLSADKWDSILEQVRLDSEVAKLTADDGATGDYFGHSVAISGDTLVVGAPNVDVGGVYDQGAAYLFSRNQGGADAWGQVAKLTANDGATEDYFGESVAVSGSILVVGAPNADVGGNVNQGAAFVYRSNAAPRAQGDSYSIDEDVTLSLEAPGVLSNDSDLDGDPLEVVINSEPAAGSLTLNSDGSFVYIPALNDNGVITFTYHTSDGQANSNVALVSITVTPVNDPPLAVADGYATYLNTPLVVGAPGLLGNDSDVDGDELNALLESEPAHGELVLNADGSFAFTPETFYEGLDSFTYLVSDGKLTASATVTIFIGRYHVFLPVEIHQ